MRRYVKLKIIGIVIVEDLGEVNLEEEKIVVKIGEKQIIKIEREGML